MTFVSFLIFLPSMLSGSLIIHLFWPERRPSALLLKLMLGAGLGMGISSFLYLGFLLVAPGRLKMFPVTVILLLVLAVTTFLSENGRKWELSQLRPPSRIQWALAVADILGLIFLALTFVNLTLSRPQGAFDAWSIWNRAARFIYRDPENWHAAISPDLYWLNHADYPLLVPLNVAWGWQAAGTETLRIPMMQGGIFTLATLGLLFASISMLRTFGQGSLAALLLAATPTFVVNGSGLIADVPLIFYMLACSVLMFLSLKGRNPVLLALSGFMAGLAGWTKNEGLLFLLASLLALISLERTTRWRSLLFYATGLAIPLVIILYFKSIAPSNDLFTDPAGSIVERILDPSRYWTILAALGEQLLTFGRWPFSILIGLLFYGLIVGGAPPIEGPRAVPILAAMILLQSLGYFAIFVLTPHDLQWHLGTSLGRLILHMFPIGIFILFCVTRTPEQIFHGTPTQGAVL